MTTLLLSVDDFLTRSSAELADIALSPCPLCGAEHRIPFRAMLSKAGVMAEIPERVEALLGKKIEHPVVIYDAVLADLVEHQALSAWRAAWQGVRGFPMQGEAGHLLDSGLMNGNVAAAEIATLGADLLVAVGSGVICDLTKWIATALGIPFVLCGTAPSMNGYTSITATITENGVKLSKYLDPAQAVFLDVNVLADAPAAMIRSGMGDLAARTVCNADWRLSHRIKGTYFCPLPYQMTALNEIRWLAAADTVFSADKDTACTAMQHLSEAILLSGLSMTALNGETSPSSGAEHVLSHFWDLQSGLRGLPKNFHGTQVGVSTGMMLRAYQLVRKLDPAKIDPQTALRKRRSLESIEAHCRKHYGAQADAFMKVAREKYIPDGEYVGYVRGILCNWESIWQDVSAYAAEPEQILDPFRRAHVPTTITAIQRTREEVLESLLWGNIYRPRYTLLDLLWELGLFPEMAEEIVDSVV